MQQQRRDDNSLWIYLALTFALTWALWIPTALWGQNVSTTAWGIPFILGGFGPSAAGVILLYLTRNSEERRDFWRRVVDFRRISARWYVFAFLIFPAIFAVTFLLNVVIGNPPPELETLSQIAANPVALVGAVLTGIVIGALSEELGWRGFALDRLRARWSPLASTLILAPFWWAWHLPLFFVPGTTQSAWGFGTPLFWLFTVQVVPLSVLPTWIRHRNERSILAAVLLHFAYNFTLGLVYPLTTAEFGLQVVLLSIVAAGLVLADRRGQGGT